MSDARSEARPAVSDVDVDLGQLFGSLIRNWLRILLAALVVAGLAWLLAGLATPLYRAETRIMIEARENVYTRPASAGLSESERALLDEETVASQVEVIGSADLLRQVAGQLNLAAHPEFGAAGDTSTLGNLLILLGLKGDPSQATVEERVLASLAGRLSIYRVDGTRVIVVGFSSQDPQLAADVPNAIAGAYVAGQEQAKRLSNADATEWLEPEIDDLRRRVREAEARVAEYRAGADLLVGQNNAVLPTQQLSEISSELTRARADRSAAEAKASAIRDAVGSGARVEAIPEVMAAPMVQRLRERQIQIEADIADLSASLLENHPRMRALRAQLDETARQLRAETQKVLAAADSEAASARARESQLVAEVNRLKAASAQAGDDEVELRALEREAAAQRALLESYLTRYREAAARADRNTLPADARVIERASVPHQAYFPKVIPIVAAAFAGALLVISVIILLRELFSGRAMRPAAGAVWADEPYLPAPVVSPPAAVAEEEQAAEEETPAVVETVEPPAAPVDAVEAEAEVEAAAATVEDAPVADDVHIEDADQPEEEDEMPMASSPRMEIAVTQAADRLIDGDASRAVFISPEGDEAAAISVMVARELADAGLRTVFLDLTWSGAPSAAMLESGRYPGITNLLASRAQFADVIHGDLYSDCHVLPSGTADPEQAMKAADRLPIVLEALTTAYDIVVVECGATEAAAIAGVAGEDAEVFVSAIEPEAEVVVAVADGLEAAACPDVMKVVPADPGRRPSLRGRFAA
mgnify:CR=1 FL=1